MTKDEANELLAGTVPDITPRLADMDLPALNVLLAAEIDAGARVTLVNAIDAEIAKRPEPAAEADTPAKPVEVPTVEDALEPGPMADAMPPEPGAVETPTAATAIERAGAPPSPVADVPAAAAAAEAPVERQGTIASANALPADLTGYSLDQLNAFRQQALERAGGDTSDAEVTRADAAIAALRQAGKDAPEVDTGSTKTKTVETPTAWAAATGGPTALVFKSGAETLADVPAQLLTPDMFRVVGGRPILERAVSIAREADPAMVTHAVLLDADGEQVGICEIPGGLPVGGGRSSEFPAGTILF